MTNHDEHGGVKHHGSGAIWFDRETGTSLTDAQRALVEAHLTFAERGALKYARLAQGRTEVEEFRSAAYLGLCVAALRFDPSRGVKFTTYAFFWIDQHLKRVGMSDRRQNGWAWYPDQAARASGAHGMQRIVSRVGWPTHRDGTEDTSRLPQMREDHDQAIHVAQQRARVQQSVETERERIIVAGIVAGQTQRAIGRQIGVSYGRVEQLLAAFIMRVRARFQEPST